MAAAPAELLRPLGLAYRAVGAHVIQVTTKEAAEERLELEFYPVDPWLAKGTSGPALAEQLKARVMASTWSEAGGPGESLLRPALPVSDHSSVATGPGSRRAIFGDKGGRGRAEGGVSHGARTMWFNSGEKGDSPSWPHGDPLSASHKLGLSPFFRQVSCFSS